MKIFIPLIMLFSISLNSQNYVAIDTTDYLKRKLLLENLDDEFLKFKKELKDNYKKKLRSEIQKSYTFIHNDITKKIWDKHLILQDQFTNYIDSLTNLVITNNKDVMLKDLKVYITKNNSSNAYSVGNGFVFLNIGLFRFLENEHQFSSVICHEIAHQLLNHSSENIISKARLEISEEKSYQFEEIRKAKYNTYNKSFKILKDLLYKDSKKNKKQETQADSLGYILYKNAGFAPSEFTNALKRLKTIDSLPNIELKKETYPNFFNLPNLPFKETWMAMENFDSYNYNHYKEKINQDSIKSHPELDDRIKSLKKIFSKDLTTPSPYPNLSSKNFEKLKRIAKYESVPNLFYNKQYGLSIYLILNRLEQNPNSQFYKKWLGLNFEKLYDAKKHYRFNKCVDKLIPKEQDDSYQQFLSFLWNLNLNEIQSISNFYLNKKAED